jgi:hypothetical protein
MPDYNPEHETVLHNMMNGVGGVEAGKMFGFPAYKVNGKLAVGLRGVGIIAKVGKTRAEELIGQPGIGLFEPRPGQVWRDYVLMTNNFDQHRAVFEEAVRYVVAETS